MNHNLQSASYKVTYIFSTIWTIIEYGKRDKYNENMKQNRRENQETTTAAAITTIRSRNRNKKEEKKLNKPNCYNEIVTTWLEIPIGNRMPLEKLRPSWNVYIFIGQCIQYVHTNSISIPFTVFFLAGLLFVCCINKKNLDTRIKIKSLLLYGVITMSKLKLTEILC